MNPIKIKLSTLSQGQTFRIGDSTFILNDEATRRHLSPRTYSATNLANGKQVLIRKGATVYR